MRICLKCKTTLHLCENYHKLYSLVAYLHSSSGLLIIRGKKSQISRDFWRQFAEKTVDFAGISREFSGVNFAEKQRRKPRRKIGERKKRYIGRMSNSGQERKHKSSSNTVLKAIVLVSSYKKNISFTETPGRLTYFFSCNLEPNIATQ